MLRSVAVVVTGDHAAGPQPVAVLERLLALGDRARLVRGNADRELLRLARFGPVAFCHGTPHDDDEVVLVDTRIGCWAEAFAELPDDVRTVVCGHTHMPFCRLVDRRLVVNAGRIGMPYGRAGGSWALLRNGNVELRHTAVDIDAAVARVVAESGYPERHEWADTYVRSAASDAEAIAAFGPRDGRTT